MTQHPSLSSIAIAVLTASLILALCPSTAAAEVCDKVAGEAWRPGDAPVWYFAHPVVSVVLVLAFIFAALLDSRWLYAVVSAGFLGLAAIEALILLGDWDIYSFADREGCFSTRGTMAAIALLIAAATAGLILAWRCGRPRR